MASSIRAMAMLSVCPTLRMVPNMPEAFPSCRFSTELIMAFELGEEKSEKPAPITTSMTAINVTEVCSTRKQSRIRPRAVMAMPMEARTPGLWWSESFPAAGDISAMVSGMDMRRNPASRAPRPLMYCRKRLRKNPTALVAA